MKAIPLAISDVILLDPKVFGDDRGFFLESFNQAKCEAAIGRHVTFMQDNPVKITPSGRIRLSASNGPSTASRTAQLFCASELRAEAVGNYASPLERFAGSVCEEHGSIRSRIVFRGDHKACVEYQYHKT